MSGLCLETTVAGIDRTLLRHGLMLTFASVSAYRTSPRRYPLGAGSQPPKFIGENKMTTAEKIKEALANSYELSRAELAMRTGLTREQIRWALPALLKAGEVERNIDDNGVEWLTEGGQGAVTRTLKREEVEVPERVEPSLGSYDEKALQRNFDKGWQEGFDSGWEGGCTYGYHNAWIDIEDKLGEMIRKFLGIELMEYEDE